MFDTRLPGIGGSVSGHASVISLSDGREVCLSYGTPIAVFVPGRGVLQTDRKYSVTTSRHANAFMQGSTHTVIPHAEFRTLVAPVATEA